MHCIDPILSKLILETEDTEQLDGLKQGLQLSWIESTRLLLVPVYSQFHWTLLVAQREGTGQPITWRRYDSLSKEHEESHPQQILMGNLLDPQFIQAACGQQCLWLLCASLDEGRNQASQRRVALSLA